MNKEEELISVFSTDNSALFQVAKSLLKNYGIRFWSNGEYLSYRLTVTLYTPEIKVLQKRCQGCKKNIK